MTRTRKRDDVASLLYPGDVAEFVTDGWTLRARVEDDPDRVAGDEREGLVGVVVEVVKPLTVTFKGSAWRYEHEVVLGDASLWGIDSLEGGYAKDVVADLTTEALSYARGVLAQLAEFADEQGVRS